MHHLTLFLLMNTAVIEHCESTSKYAIRMMLSTTQQDAETIYKLARLGLIYKELFVQVAVNLQKRSKIAVG